VGPDSGALPIPAPATPNRPIGTLLAGATTNQLQIAIYGPETFKLPLSVLGLAGLAMRGSPWLARIGGGLGRFGGLPRSAVAAQDDLTLWMARMGGPRIPGLAAQPDFTSGSDSAAMR
jgi:hypothetical protein